MKKAGKPPSCCSHSDRVAEGDMYIRGLYHRHSLTGGMRFFCTYRASMPPPPAPSAPAPLPALPSTSSLSSPRPPSPLRMISSLCSRRRRLTSCSPWRAQEGGHTSTRLAWKVPLSSGLSASNSHTDR